MRHRESSRRTTRQLPFIVLAGAVVAVAATAVSLGNPLLSSGSSASSSSPPPPSGLASSASPMASLLGGRSGAPGGLGSAAGLPPEGAIVLRPGHVGRVGKADGVLPDRVTVLDTQYPAIANLDHDLLEALRQAATNAAKDGIEIFVTSGWRSRAYQDQLFRQAVSDDGSEAKAAEWVAPPGTSAHESGDAVDVGPSAAAAWLSQNGAQFGLCQIYRNEPWHYELRREAMSRGCPVMYADPTFDPRTQR